MAEKTDAEIEVADEDEELYVEYDIATYPSDNTLTVLRQMWRDEDIAIPKFQRGFVWNQNQASLLVESFLRGLPVPPIFLFVDEDNKNLVVDGLQRLSSIMYFYEGYFGPASAGGKRQVFKLSGLNKKSRFFNKSYDDLSEVDKRKFNNSVLRAVNIRQLAPNDDISSIYHIFERLNTGGTPLSPQEIRNTVYRGDIIDELQNANTDPDWRLIFGREDPDRRERDTEIVLRLLGLFIVGIKYERPMKRFLNNTMYSNRNVDTKDAKRFFKIWPDICEYITDELGEKPFHPRGPLNVAVLDSVFTALAQKWPDKPADLQGSVNALLEDKDYMTLCSARTGDTDVVRNRISMAKAALF